MLRISRASATNFCDHALYRGNACQMIFHNDEDDAVLLKLMIDLSWFSVKWNFRFGVLAS